MVSRIVSIVCGFFFFQAEDGIRDADVTGVQTCALPIYPACRRPPPGPSGSARPPAAACWAPLPTGPLAPDRRRLSLQAGCFWPCVHTYHTGHNMSIYL